MGLDWFMSYVDTSIGGYLFIGIANAISWGLIIALSQNYKKSTTIIYPALLGFSFVAWGHLTLDLSADAQAALGFLFIPIYSIPFILTGWVIGLIIEKYNYKKTTT
tara:strand:- start:446 stop:763 length:318 start_codon:yes stop_codon:yes gene_type:complete